MLEKEIKILDIDTAEVMEKLEELGAKKHFVGYIHDVYYDFPEGSIEANKRLFRVRQKGEEHIYTIKRKRNKKEDGGEKGVKIADEHETKITDVESFSKVLEKYGMNKTREKKKFRVSYSIGHVEFDIDDYHYGDNKTKIPPFMEIEATSSEELQAWVKTLGLEKHKQKTFGSRKLFEYYGEDYNYFD